jgi:hypothetical protein
MPDTPTAYYGFPIPSPIDPADAPHDFRALAQKIEDTLKNGYVIPTGNLTVGDPVAGVGANYLSLAKKVAADVLEWRFAWYTDGLIVQANKNNAQDSARASYVFGSDGAIQAYTYAPSMVVRPVPFATWAGSGSVTLSNTVSGTAVITLPSGRFTQGAVFTVTTTASAGLNHVASLSASTLTSITVAIRHVDNIATSGSVGFHVHGIQMTSTSGPG